jgi:hypothetical protein
MSLRDMKRINFSMFTMDFMYKMAYLRIGLTDLAKILSQFSTSAGIIVPKLYTDRFTPARIMGDNVYFDPIWGLIFTL